MIFSKDIHFNEIFKSSSLAFVVKVLGYGITYLFTFIITKYIGIGELGAFSICLSVISLSSIFSRLGLDTASMKIIASNFKNKDFNEQIFYRKILLLVTLLSSIFLILVYFNADFIANKIFNKDNISGAIKISSLGILPFSLISLNSFILRGKKKVTYFIFFNSLSPYLFGILLLIVFYFTSINSTISAYVGGLVISLALSFLVVKKSLNSKVVCDNINIKLKPIIQLAIPLFLASSMTFLKGRIDSIMIGIYLPTENVGEYFVAFKIAAILSLPLNALNSIIAPKIAEFFSKNDKENLKKSIYSSTKLLFVISFPLFLIIILFSNKLLGLFNVYSITAKYALIILTLGQFISSISGSVGVFLQMSGDEKTYRNLTGGILILNVILNFALIPTIGLIGAAISSTIGLVLFNLTSVVIIRNKHKIQMIFIPFKKKFNE